MIDSRDEICASILSLRGALDDVLVRGVRAATADDLGRLAAIGEELERIGAHHLAGRIADLLGLARGGEGGAAAALMRAQASLRVFERVLTLETVGELLAPVEEDEVEDEDDDEGDHGEAHAAAAVEPADRGALVPVLEELTRAVEDLVSTGLTTASAATRHKLDASFKEAARQRLLRLAAALRYVNEEIGRFLADSEHFSGKRLSFFLSRAWLLACGLSRAIRAGDQAALAQLLLTTTPTMVKSLDVVVLGVQKRVVQDGACSFDFRLRVVAAPAPLAAGQRLLWSCLFPARAGVPAEAYLHLPQPQKFSPKVLLEDKVITVTGAAVALDGRGGGRLMLGPKSTVSAGAGWDGWERFHRWSPGAARARVAAHRPSPLDLEVEMQEEIVLDEWDVDGPAPREGRGDQVVYPIRWRERTFDAVVSTGAEGRELAAALDRFANKKRVKRPPLFAVMHYELCRLVLQPLSLLPHGEPPTQLMISRDKIDLAALMNTLDFR